MARRALALVEHPPIITALTTRGDIIAVHSYITGLEQRIASWNGENLHIFMVASLALLLSVPLRSRSERIKLAGVSLVIISLVMLAICVVQLKIVAETYASMDLGITLHTAREKAVLDWANRGLWMVGMLLLPAFLFLNSYLSFWSESQVSVKGEDARVRSRVTRTQSSQSSWRPIVPAAALFAGVWIFMVIPRADPAPGIVLEGLNRVLALNPSVAHAHFSLGFHHEREGRPGKALEFYQAALRLDPNLVTAHFGMGNVLFRQGEYEEAARCYEEVLRRDPTHASARYNLGNALLESGDYSRAAQTYEEALRVNPKHASAQKNLGVALIRLDRACEALRHLERSAALDRRYSADTALGAEILRIRSVCHPTQDTSLGIPVPLPQLVDREAPAGIR